MRLALAGLLVALVACGGPSELGRTELAKRSALNHCRKVYGPEGVPQPPEWQPKPCSELVAELETVKDARRFEAWLDVMGADLKTP